jgi:hypothetical protein
MWGEVGCLLEKIVEGGDSSHMDPTTIIIRTCREGLGRLLEEIVEHGDSSHVDPTTIMVRTCGEGWAASLRRLWWVETPPTWTPPPSW